ncbi:MAG: 23S rRNA (guanosine(2251)-2'-O)-methyltransferase RlmB [Candidatus Omnitrophota bacterium]
MKLFGKNPVLERLRSNPKSVRKIHISEGHPDGSYVRKKAFAAGIPVVFVPHSKMVKLSKSLNTQGILAEVDDFVYMPFDELLRMAEEKNLSIVFLDELNDPQNLGAIIRSLACLGGFGIVLPTHDSVDITEAVLRVASGADNYIPVAKVSNLNSAISLAKKSGIWIVGAVTKEGKDLRDISFSFPLALVLGSEQKGIRDIILKQIDLPVTIPMSHPQLSLNVAQATGMIGYEIAKQKKRR